MTKAKSNTISLTLFGAVVKEEKSGRTPKPNLSLIERGIIVSPEAVYAMSEISEWAKTVMLTPLQLNSTFHKSWNKIKTSSRFELLLHQLMHYCTTYGSDFQSDYIYIPDEKLEVPEISVGDYPFRYVQALDKSEIIERGLKMLQSGQAMVQATIEQVIDLLTMLGHQFSNNDGIRNKEAAIILADKFGLYPEQPTEFLRYVLFKLTADSLLIKNDKKMQEVKSAIVSNKDFVAKAFQSYGLEKLATIFNRFKPIFLAMKYGKMRAVVNKLSKLSKTLHVPMRGSALNEVTQRLLTNSDLESIGKNANVMQIARALNACLYHLSSPETFLYKIRNGKGWVNESNRQGKKMFLVQNSTNLQNILVEKLKHLKGKKVYIPDFVEYAIPVSEKQYVGNIPAGTRFVSDSGIIAGVYWKNDGGANDIDLSGVAVSGKVGWNSSYNSKGLTYSGDMTDAKNGAVEYLYGKNLTDDYLVLSNIFMGKDDCQYAIIWGKGDNPGRDYMMNPNNVLGYVETQSQSKQTILGAASRIAEKDCFVVMNISYGATRVSRSESRNELAVKAIINQYKTQASLNDLLVLCGATIVANAKDADIDLSLQSLQKDTLLSIFDADKKW